MYSKWADSEFAAKIIPFGALVEFLPPESRQKEQPDKWSSPSTPGIFLGYELGERGKWNNIYSVLALKDFANVNLAAGV